MRLVLKITSWLMIVVLILGAIGLSEEGSMDGGAFVALLLLLSQNAFTLIYINDVKEVTEKTVKTKIKK